MDGNECWPGGLSWRKKLGLGNSFLLAHRFIVCGLGLQTAASWLGALSSECLCPSHLARRA